MWLLPSDLDDVARRALTTYFDLLEAWNARLDLTAAKTREAMVTLMLEDARVLAKHVRDGARVIDVGAGAGAPGLVLAILRPDLKVTLVEPLQKRVAFLRTVLGTIGRADVTVLAKRAEQVQGEWDEALSRATFAPEEWLAIGAKLAPRVWVLLAREAPPEGTRVIDETYGDAGRTRRVVAYQR